MYVYSLQLILVKDREGERKREGEREEERGRRINETERDCNNIREQISCPN